MTHEHHDFVVEKESSGFGALAVVLSVIVLLVVLWFAFGNDTPTDGSGGSGDVTVPTTGVAPTE